MKHNCFFYLIVLFTLYSSTKLFFFVDVERMFIGNNYGVGDDSTIIPI